jgi:glycosyltransferase involved in cell wall biosynthesis
MRMRSMNLKRIIFFIFSFFSIAYLFFIYFTISSSEKTNKKNPNTLKQIEVKLEEKPFVCTKKCRGREILNERNCVCERKKYSICIVTNEFYGVDKHGGIGSSFYRLAKFLSNLHDYKVTIAYAGYPFCTEGNKDKCEFKKWRENYLKEKIYFRVLKEVEQFKGNEEMKKSFKIFNWLKQNELQFDIIHFHDYLGLGYYSMMSKKMKISFDKNILVNGLHGTSWFVNLAQNRNPYDLNILKMKYFEEISLEFSDAVVSPSKFYLNWINNETNIKLPTDQQVIPNIMNSNVIVNKINAIEKQNDIGHLVFMGRFSPVKGFDIFLDALNELSLDDQISSKIKKITFLGNFESQDLPKSIEKFFKIKTLKWKSDWEVKYFIGKDTTFCMKYLLENKGLAVIPSRIETYSYVVVELLHNKIPFIASNAGAIPELMSSFQNQILFEPELNSLIDKLKNVLNNGIIITKPIHSIVEINQFWFDWHKKHLLELQSLKKELTFKKEEKERLGSISVILTLHSTDNLLNFFILKQFLNQDFQDFELIILHYYSNEEFIFLKTKFKKLKIRGLSFQTSAAESKNMAAKLSTNDYLLFFSSNEIPKKNLISEFLNIFKFSNFKILFDFYDYSPQLKSSMNQRQEIEIETLKPTETILQHAPSSNVEFFEPSSDKSVFSIERNLFLKFGGFEKDLSLIQILNCEHWQINSKISLLVEDFNVGVIPKPLHWSLSLVDRKLTPKEEYLNLQCSKRVLGFYLKNTPSRIHGWLLFSWRKYWKIKNKI